LIGTIVLFKCNNPFRKYFIEKKIEYKEKQVVKNVESIKYVYLKDSTRHEIKNGIIHAVKQTAVGKEFELEIFYKNKLDSISKSLDISKKQIDNTVDANISANGKISSFIENMNGYYELSFSDSFLHGYAIIDTGITNINLFYSAMFKIHGTLYWKRKYGFLGIFRYGKKIYWQDLYTNCNNVKIDSITSIKVQHEH
jgi:hypothetical protein